MTRNQLDRRSWMSGVGAAAAGVALGATGVGAQAAAAQPAAPFQPARHELDAWFDSLPGKHRVVLDATSAKGAAEGIGYSNNVYNASRTGYQLTDADLALVLVLRHDATSFAFNNAMWAKYGKQLAEGAEYKDSNSADVPKSNPRNSGERPALDRLAARGAHFAVCGLSTRLLASMIAGPNGDTDAVIKELSANTIPNAHIMPAGVVAIQRAQEYGYSLIHVG